MKGSTSMVKNIAKAHFTLQINQSMKANLSITRFQEKALTNGTMENFIQEVGMQTKCMVMES